MPQLKGIGGVPMVKQSTVLTPDTFYDYLLIIDLEGTCGEGGALISSTSTKEMCVCISHILQTSTNACKLLTNIEQSQVDAAVE